MFVKPSNTSPSAIRKARYEADLARRNAEAKARVIASLAKPLDIARTPECGE